MSKRKKTNSERAIVAFGIVRLVKLAGNNLLFQQLKEQLAVPYCLNVNLVSSFFRGFKVVRYKCIEPSTYVRNGDTKARLCLYIENIDESLLYLEKIAGEDLGARKLTGRDKMISTESAVNVKNLAVEEKKPEVQEEPKVEKTTVPEKESEVQQVSIPVETKKKTPSCCLARISGRFNTEGVKDKIVISDNDVVVNLNGLSEEKLAELLLASFQGTVKVSTENEDFYQKVDLIKMSIIDIAKM